MEGAGPRTSVSPTSTTSCAWQWSAHQRFHPQPVLLLTSGDQAMLGRARAGVGGTTPTDTFQSTTPTDPPFSSVIPFNPPHPQMHVFRQRYLSIHHTALHPQIHCFRQRYLSLLHTIQSGPGQQFTASYNNAPALVHNSPAKQGNDTGLF